MDSKRTRKYRAWVEISLEVEQPEADTETERQRVWDALNSALGSGVNLVGRLDDWFDSHSFGTGLRSQNIVVRVTTIEVDDVDHPDDFGTSG
jgi:hypothetical protein